MLIVIAAIANGLPFLAKRTGLWESEQYDAYWAAECPALGKSSSLIPLACCQVGPDVYQRGSAAAGHDEFGRYLYRTEGGGQIALKVFKDLLAFGVVAVSVFFVVTGRGRLVSPRAAWPVALICVIAFVGAVRTAAADPVVAIAGGRSFLFAFLALVTSWLTRDLKAVAIGAGALLSADLLVLPFELSAGLPLRSCPLPMRASAFHVTPNGLGIFAACCVPFAWPFLPGTRSRLALAVGAVVLLAVSGSGSGWVCLALAAAVAFVTRSRAGFRPWRAVVSALAVAMVVMSLPWLTGREDVWSSLRGRNARLTSYQALLTEPRPMAATLFGDGLGIGTYGAVTGAELGLSKGSAAAIPFSSESAVLSIFRQTGLIGIVACAWLLGTAAWRDPPLAPFYAAMATAALTAHVSESFPLNLLLGVALCHSYQADDAP